MVPVIDLAPFTTGAEVSRRAVAAAVDAACREVGFFTVIGHGITPATFEATWTAALAFFELPIEQRMTVAMPYPGYPYGYNPFNVEALNRSIGGHAPPDLKETFNVGPIDRPPRPIEEMDDDDERAVYAPNLWPDEVCSALRPALEAYYRSMAGLAAHLMEVFAVALGLTDGWFAPYIDRHGSALRVAHYPALVRVPQPGQLRAGAHTDYGTLTILAIDEEPGLQVQLADGDWIDVEHVEGGLVVNLGDLMQRWTNDRWRSTMHRVVIPVAGSGRRLSIPFFHNANWDAEVVCLVGPDESPRHPPVTAGRHLMAKFRSTVT